MRKQVSFDLTKSGKIALAKSKSGSFSSEPRLLSKQIPNRKKSKSSSSN